MNEERGKDSLAIGYESPISRLHLRVMRCLAAAVMFVGTCLYLVRLASILDFLQSVSKTSLGSQKRSQLGTSQPIVPKHNRSIPVLLNPQPPLHRSPIPLIRLTPPTLRIRNPPPASRQRSPGRQN